MAVLQVRKVELLMSAFVHSSVWNVPYQRNPFFTGREDILLSLHSVLAADTTATLVDAQALSGLGGIGKTQAAVEYAYRYASEYPEAILWVRANSREVLASDFVGIAELLALPEKSEQDLELTIAAVLRWMKDHSRWLLVLDNVETQALAEEFLPTAHRGHILLTTRAQAVRAIANPIRVEIWTPDMGALFLLRRTKIIALHHELKHAAPSVRDIARAIAQEMDGLPLALEQAGAYIEMTSCDLSTYLALYRRRRSALLKRGSSFDDGHPESVTTTFSLSFQKVQEANRTAIELLQCCAFFSPEAILESIITDGAFYLGSTLRRFIADPLKLDETLRELLRYSLIQRNADPHTLTIHRLVQAILKDKMDSQKRRRWAERVVRAMSHVFPTVEVATWSFCQQCLPHALECAAHIEQQQMSFPEAAHLLNQAGYYLEDRAQYLQAEPLYQHALEIRERTLGSNHPDTAQSLNNLASLYECQGKYEEAEPLYQRALEVRERIAGPNHPDTAQSLNNLAELYRVQGKYKAAEPLYLRALTIWEQALGPGDPETASCLNNLGLLYESLARRQEAEQCFHRALAIDEQAFGSDHPNVATDLNNLAELYRAQGKYEEAEPLLQRALAIWEQADPDHPDTAVALNSLAELYRSQGKYEEAEPLLQRALAIWEQVDPDHPYGAVGLNNLALLYDAQGKQEKAETLLQRAFQIQEKALGPDHPDTARYLSNLAGFYEKQGKYDRAVSFYQRALKIAEGSLGSEHPSVTTLKRDYAAVLSKEQYDE